MQSYSPLQPQASDMDQVIHQASMVSGPNYSNSEDATQLVNDPVQFFSQYVDSMEMYADIGTVSRYLDVHHEWFRRCAHPMKAEAIGENSYALVIGKFGSFGYEVEPKIGLDLLPQSEGIYRIETVPVPDYTPAGYDVDFRAAMELLEMAPPQLLGGSAAEGGLPDKITRVQWQLDLTVLLQFPRFIHALPKALIQSTGDRVLNQVVRQVSARLTRKVLDDFHTSHNITVPKRSKLRLFRKPEELN